MTSDERGSEPRIRLVTESQREGLSLVGLHQTINAELTAEVAEALRLVRETFEGRNEVDLVEVLSLLSKTLGAKPGLKTAVDEAFKTGGSTLDPEQLLEALAAWVLDRFLNEALLWPSGALQLRDDG